MTDMKNALVRIKNTVADPYNRKQMTLREACGLMDELHDIALEALKGERQAFGISEIDCSKEPMMITQPDGPPVTCFTVSQLHRIRTEAMEAGARQERERVRRAVEDEIRRMVAEGTYSVAEVDIMRRAEALIDPKEVK